MKSNRVLLRLLFLALPCFLVACANRRPGPGSLLEVPALPGSGKVHRVLVATNRAPETRAGTYFNGKRGDALTFQRIDVSVPACHKAGRLEHAKRGKPDPARHFANVGEACIPSPEAFRAELRKQVKASKGRQVVIFVHGYNTLFTEAVLVRAQICHDTNFGGVPVLFSWPSEGKLVGYVYDRDSVMASRDALDQTIRMASESGASEVLIFAHSMGSLLTMETLRQAKIRGDSTYGGKVRHVLLASPDISIDVFKSQMKTLGSKPQIAVLLSRDDRALSFSRWMSGDVERVGNFSDYTGLAEMGVIAVDLTNVKVGDVTRHAKFAQMPAILTALAVHFKSNKLQSGDGAGLTTQTLVLGGRKAAEIIVTSPARVVSGLLDVYAR